MPEPGTFFIASTSILGGLSSLSGSAAKVYMFLCCLANTETGISYPSHATIAAATGSSERSVRRALKELVSAKLIAVTNRGRCSNLYKIVFYPANQGRISLSGQIKTGQSCPVIPVASGHSCPDEPGLTGQNEQLNRTSVADELNSRTKRSNEAGESKVSDDVAKRVFREMTSSLGFALDSFFWEISQRAAEDDRVFNLVAELLVEISVAKDVRNKRALFARRYQQCVAAIEQTTSENS